MSIPKDIINFNPGLGDWSILSAYRGSISHGMYIPENDPNSIDDKDVMSVCIPPVGYYFGLHQGGWVFPENGTKEIKQNEWDIVIYEARKFIKLLAQGNPNVLCMLWVEENYLLNITEEGRLLRDNRDLFVGRHVYKSFVGYAYGQLHRMTHINKKGYEGDKRRKLVEKFGYDTKNAAHLIRLLRMGIEFLKDGELSVMRPDASQLLEIKKGEWLLSKVIEESDRLFIVAGQAYINSYLPKLPDYEQINKLSVKIISSFLDRCGT